MKFAKIYKLLLEDDEPELAQQTKQQAPPSKKEVPEEKPEIEEDPLRSNIDQFWMNPEDLKSDLDKFLTKINTEDPKLARYLINTIRNTIGKFRYAPEQEKTN